MRGIKAALKKAGIIRVSIFCLLLLTFLFAALLINRQISSSPEEELLVHSVSLPPGWSYSAALPGEAPLPLDVIWNEQGYLGSAARALQPGETIAYSCVLTSAIPDAQLSIPLGFSAAIVFLDDTLIYSDFSGQRATLYDWPAADGNIEEIFDSWQARSVTVALPADYTGKTLTIIEYPNPSMLEYWYPIIPDINDPMAFAVFYAVDKAPDYISAGVFGVAALALLLLLGYQLFDGRPNWALALPIIFALVRMASLCAVPILQDETNAMLDRIWVISRELAPDLMLAFLAIRMTAYKKYMIFGILAAHLAVFAATAIDSLITTGTVVELYYHNNPVLGLTQFTCYIVAFAACFGEWRRGDGYFALLCKGIIAGAVLVAVLPPSLWMDSEVIGGWRELISLAIGLNFISFLNLFSNFLMFMVLVLSAWEYIASQIHRRTSLQTLELKNRLMMESFDSAQASILQADIARHDLRHHAAVLQTLLDSGATTRMADYLRGLADQGDSLPPARCCENLLISSILQNRLALAISLGIDVSCEAVAGESIAVADIDLCSILMNMLDNAIDACKRLPDDRRSINIRIHQRGGLLAISCKNTWDGVLLADDQTLTPKSIKKDPGAHGYGIAAMRAAAEKYNSMLDIDYNDEYFSVQTCLQFNDAGA